MTVKEIAEYIIKNYEDSCLAYNSRHHDYSDEELAKECEDYFYHEKLNWCSCGDPEAAKRCIRDYLDIINLDYDNREQFVAAYELKKADMKKRFGATYVYDNELLLCLAYAMDGAGFTEHGGSIGGAWLTDEGKMFLFLLKMNKELDEAEESE